LFSEIEKSENFKPEFRKYVNDLYQYEYSPEEIMGYIYAVMYSPFYNEKYKDELSKEFARIPFVKSRELFETMSQLGWELIQVHLENTVSDYGLGAFIGSGDYKVEKISYNEAEEKLSINSTQYFKRVPEDIVHFKIGSYPVILHYLKTRKGRVLTLEEINHLENVVNILAFTLQQIKKIDEVYKKIDHLMERDK
jgi:predicted helicase